MDAERITPDELAYHARVVEQAQAAEAVQRAWGAHLAAKYRIGPGEHIDAAGAIHRTPKTPEPA